MQQSGSKETEITPRVSCRNKAQERILEGSGIQNRPFKDEQDLDGQKYEEKSYCKLRLMTTTSEK